MFHSVSPTEGNLCLESECLSFLLYPTRVCNVPSITSDKENQKLVSRIKRIRGQVESIERSLTAQDDCADVLMLLAAVRGGVNSLMAEILEDHIRLHLLSPEKASARPQELADDMIDLVRAYLK